MRRIELGYGLSITGELAGTVALVVYALGAGGATLVAAYAASRTVAGMGVALVLTGITSRLRRDRLLRWSTGVRMVLLAAAALLAALHQPPAAVIAAGAASSALSGTYRPLQAAVLPWLVRTPAELAASNAVTAVMENGGALIGPLLAGGVLAVASPSRIPRRPGPPAPLRWHATSPAAWLSSGGWLRPAVSRFWRSPRPCSAA